MEKSMSKVLVETMVRKTIRDIREAPERSIRNIVDMALQFSNGRFQKYFFETVQVMLQNEKSGYYALIRDVAEHVDSERLLTFGMNLGYNSCTLGAAMIRDREAKSGFNIPWSVSFEFDDNSFLKCPNRYDAAIEEGEEMGIFSWIFLVRNNLKKTLRLIASHPDSAFFVICEGREITPEIIDRIHMLDNVMLIIKYDDNIETICKTLREEKMLYGAYYMYTEKDVESIANGDLIYTMQQQHPLVTVFMSDMSCSKEIRNYVYKLSQKARVSHEYQTIVWDMYGDNCFVDEVISDDACFVYFDKDGKLCGLDDGVDIERNTLFTNSLQEILMRAFKKEKNK